MKQIYRNCRNLWNRLSTEGSACADLQIPSDANSVEIELIQRVLPFTMTGAVRVLALIRSVAHVSQKRIPGAFVECGVWRGGSMMAAALTLRRLGDFSRDLYLFDTFKGMPEPVEIDSSIDGQSAREAYFSKQEQGMPWCSSSKDEVWANIKSTGYPLEKVHLVEGMVEDTIPDSSPDCIALLRLDTDWYQSTRHEMEHLYPCLSDLGILIIDDYGHWQGARKAVDEYFAREDSPPYLHRVDYSCRECVKIPPVKRG